MYRPQTLKAGWGLAPVVTEQVMTRTSRAGLGSEEIN
jgi:hypothetical protein